MDVLVSGLIDGLRLLVSGDRERAQARRRVDADEPTVAVTAGVWLHVEVVADGELLGQAVRAVIHVVGMDRVRTGGVLVFADVGLVAADHDDLEGRAFFRRDGQLAAGKRAVDQRAGNAERRSADRMFARGEKLFQDRLEAYGAPRIFRDAGGERPRDARPQLPRLLARVLAETPPGPSIVGKVFPGAEHSRFAHVLGAMHLARIGVGVRSLSPGVPGLFAVDSDAVVRSLILRRASMPTSSRRRLPTI